jgi:hypothetical protein
MIIDTHNVDNLILFWYIVIFICTIYVFSQFEIKLNIFYGTFIVGIIIYFLHQSHKNKQLKHANIINEKKESIFPPIHSSKHYTNVVNFLFSIQDFYQYNPQAYEDMIESIDMFFSYYHEILINNSLASTNYDILIDKKTYALNSLQSIIYTLPNNTLYTKKLNNSVKILNDIFQEYINNVKFINKNNIHNHGYTNKTKIISNDEIVPYNTFSKQHTTFELY